MAEVNHLHSDELQPNLSAVAAAGSSLPKEPPVVDLPLTSTTLVIWWLFWGRQRFRASRPCV